MSIELANYRKSIINRSLWIAAGVSIILSFLNHKDFALGILIGVGVSAVNFLLLSLQVARMGTVGKKAPFLFTFIIRYGLLALCLYFIVKTPQINIFGFLIGYFILQLNLFLSAFLSRTQKKVEPEVGEVTP